MSSILQSNTSAEKNVYSESPQKSVDVGYTGDVDLLSEDEFEIFKKTTDGVDFRTVEWPRAAVIFLKVIFATGVLSIPTAMYSLGAVGGALSVIGWGALNTYGGYVQGNFRNMHAGCHSIADMCTVISGSILKEVAGVLYLIAYILCAGSGIVGVSTGLNALSHHSACTVWWSFLATVVVALCASVRKFHQIGWLTYAGFASIFIAVFIVVIGVTTRSRPAAAPQTGDFELGFFAIASPTFIAGMTASATIFVSSAATSAFLPVIAEMKHPKDYNKALFSCMGFVTAAYLAFSLVVYAWCGQWVASPSLGSAGQTVKMVAYGIGLIGLTVSACLYVHIAAKYLFVRILRNSEHLQHGTMVHWVTWLSCTFGISAISFLLAEAIPIFNYLLSFAGSLCFAPLGIMLPGWLWLYDHSEYRTGSIGKQVAYWLHWLIIAIGLFLSIGGTYATVQSIIDAYASGSIGSAFSCLDNSNSS